MIYCFVLYFCAGYVDKLMRHEKLGVREKGSQMGIHGQNV